LRIDSADAAVEAPRAVTVEAYAFDGASVGARGCVCGCECGAASLSAGGAVISATRRARSVKRCSKRSVAAIG
jgi:hypothetical protein